MSSAPGQRVQDCLAWVYGTGSSIVSDNAPAMVLWELTTMSTNRHQWTGCLQWMWDRLFMEQLHRFRPDVARVNVTQIWVIINLCLHLGDVGSVISEWGVFAEV